MNDDLKNAEIMARFADAMVSAVKDIIKKRIDDGTGFHKSSFFKSYAEAIASDEGFASDWIESIQEMMLDTGLYFRKFDLPDGCRHLTIDEAVDNYNSSGFFGGCTDQLWDKEYTPKQYEHSIDSIIRYFNKTNVSNHYFVIFTLDLFFYNMLSFGYRPVFRNRARVMQILRERFCTLSDVLPRTDKD